MNTLSLDAGRLQVISGRLVGLTPLGQEVFLDRLIERAELLLFRAVVTYTDDSSIDKDDLAIALGDDLGAAVTDELLLNAGTDDRSFASHQRHCLAHHVRSHERAVGIVVLKEWDKSGSDGSNLVGSHVAESNFGRQDLGEVGTLTNDNALVEELAMLIHARSRLSNVFALLCLSRQPLNAFVGEIDNAILNLAVWSLNESEVIDLGIDAHRGDKTDVRTFWRLDWTQTTIVGVVYVTNLETCTLT